MNERAIFKNFVEYSTLDEGSSELLDVLTEIENLLSESGSTHLRIKYLESLAAEADGSNETDPGAINPLTSEETTAIVRFGILGAIENKEVSHQKIIALSHSIPEIRNFIDILFQASPNDRAAVWSATLIPPEPVNAVNLHKMFNDNPVESLWEQLTSLAESVCESIAPPQLDVSMGYRSSGITGAELCFDPDMEIFNRSVLAGRISELDTKMKSKTSQDLADYWSRFPWAEIQNLTGETETWTEFLIETGKIINESLAQPEVNCLLEWTNSTDLKPELDKTSQNLLILLLLSSFTTDET